MPASFLRPQIQPFSNGLHFSFCGFLVRSVHVPHERAIAPAMQQIGVVDFQQLKTGSVAKWVTRGASLYRAGAIISRSGSGMDEEVKMPMPRDTGGSNHPGTEVPAAPADFPEQPPNPNKPLHSSAPK